jgi:hypothetical protein
MTVDDKRNYTLEQQLAHKTATTRDYNKRHGNGGFFDKPVALSVSEAEKLQAELTRLTDALAAAERERDAAMNVITEAYNILVTPYAYEATGDEATGQMVDEHQRVTELLGNALETTPPPAAPTPPPADTGAGELTEADFAKIKRNLDDTMIKDAIQQAHYTIEFMQTQAAEENYAAAFEHLAVVLVNHNIALSTLHKGETYNG